MVKKLKNYLLIGLILSIFFVFSLSFISSADVLNELHLNIQTTDVSTGEIVTGTFSFVFNITTSSDCTGVVYSNSTSLTTDSRGIISYYLQNINLNFTQQYYLCYYRDGVLINNSKIARTPYSFTAQNTTISGLIIDSNLSLGTYNFSASSIYGNLYGAWNGSSDYYLKTNPYSFWNSTFATFNKTYADTLYYGINNPFGYYNSTTLSGSGTVNGSGTLGYIPMWNGTTSLNNSLIYQYSGKIGINNTSPSATLNVNGTFKAEYNQGSISLDTNGDVKIGI